MPIHPEEHARSDHAHAGTRAQLYHLMRAYERAPESDADALDLRLLKLVKGASPELRTETAGWLSGLRRCPPRSVRALACDPDPQVASPILRRSTVICERTLAEMALCKGQAQLEAIAGRKNLAESVTRILIRRGDRLVLQTLARNRTAAVAPHCRRRLLARLGQETAVYQARPRPRRGPVAAAAAV